MVLRAPGRRGRRRGGGRLTGPLAQSAPNLQGHSLRLQGYLDARSRRHVAGWVRNLDDPAHKPQVEVVLDGVVIATSVADRHSDILVAVGVGNGDHAFHVEYPAPLATADAARVIVRPALGSPLELAPALVTDYVPWGIDPARFQGYIDACSTRHIAGWARNIDDPSEKLGLEIVLPAPAHSDQDDRVIATAQADRYAREIAEIGVGEGVHAFYAEFSPPLTLDERDRVEVRVARTTRALPRAPEVRTAYEPIAYLAMDIVNNCNLRCPFCLVDYSEVKTTKLMSDATFEAAMRLLPYVSDGNFWLSCLHEATLHPKLLDFIARVPREYRSKLFYTTNLAKRMPDNYFEAVCGSGMHHLNISIESLDPAIYEKMRAGARFRIFQENWDKLLAHHATGSAPPPLRYNVMCYRSNLKEIPGLIDLLLNHKRGWMVELRHTYDAAHIASDFRREEYLTTAEWAWLKAALAHHDPAKVALSLPLHERGYEGQGEPPADAMAGDTDTFRPHLGEGEGPYNRMQRPFLLSMNWEGLLRVQGWKPLGHGQSYEFNTYLKANIHFLPDPIAFFASL